MSISIAWIIACQGLTNEKVNELEQHFNPSDSLRTILANLMALPDPISEKLTYTKTLQAEKKNYLLYRVVIQLGNQDSIPAFYLIPKHMSPPFPAMICLQGHAPGMYISIGETRSDRDQQLIAGGRDIAIQAVNHGWAALAVEQRGFGEQAAADVSCNHQSLNYALMGKTMLGQRVSDICRSKVKSRRIRLDAWEIQREVR